jgi:hypothetical protein
MPRTGAAAARLRGILAPPPPPPPPAVTVQELPGRGRCLIASRDFAKGETNPHRDPNPDPNPDPNQSIPAVRES